MNLNGRLAQPTDRSSSRRSPIPAPGRSCGLCAWHRNGSRFPSFGLTGSGLRGLCCCCCLLLPLYARRRCSSLVLAAAPSSSLLLLLLFRCGFPKPLVSSAHRGCPFAVAGTSSMLTDRSAHLPGIRRAGYAFRCLAAGSGHEGPTYPAGHTPLSR